MTMGMISTTRQLAQDWTRSLRRTWMWAALQTVAIALLTLAGLGWTRISEKHAWQVALSILIPLLLAASFLLLQAGMLRAMLRARRDDGMRDGLPRVSLAWGAATLIVWIAFAWLAWMAIDRPDDQLINWASYLNSRFGAGARARIATYAHIFALLTWAERILHWVVVPGLLLPLAASAHWGLRQLPWRRVLRVWVGWRWWLGVLIASALGVFWPQSFFDTPPHGTVSAQVWHVVLKLIAAYLLAIASWIGALAWMAALLNCDPAPREDADDDSDELAGVGVRLKPPDGGKRGSVRLPLPEGEDSSGNA